MIESVWNFIIDFVSKPDKVLISLIAHYNNWVYIFLFLVIFAETGLIVASFLMPFIPGDALIWVKENLEFMIWGIVFVANIPLIRQVLSSVIKKNKKA